MRQSDFIREKATIVRPKLLTEFGTALTAEMDKVKQNGVFSLNKIII
jgi:hypothetical protein